MEKVIRCGDLVPGCDFVARASTEDELMSQVAAHARTAHGMEQIPPEVAEKARASVREEPRA